MPLRRFLYSLKNALENKAPGPDESDGLAERLKGAAVGAYPCLVTEPAECMCNVLSVGDIASIVAGLAALAGLLFAGIEIRDSRRQREEEASRRVRDNKDYRASMARSVGMNVEDQGTSGNRHTFLVTVRNSSRFPVERVEVVAANTPLDNPYDAPDQFVTRVVKGTLFPESHKSHTFEWPEGLKVDAQPDVDLTFVDTWGQRWVKTWNGSLVAHGEPEIPFPIIKDAQ